MCLTSGDKAKAFYKVIAPVHTLTSREGFSFTLHWTCPWLQASQRHLRFSFSKLHHLAQWATIPPDIQSMKPGQHRGSSLSAHLRLASPLLCPVASALVGSLSLLGVFTFSPRPSWAPHSPSGPLQPDLPTAVTVTFSKIWNLILLLPFAYRVKELAPAPLPRLSLAIPSSFGETSQFYLHRAAYSLLRLSLPPLDVYSSLMIQSTSPFSTDPSAW